jgi:hypothetical protein
VDLAEVEGDGGEMEFAGRRAQAAAGEPVKDLLQVADACGVPEVGLSL